MRVWEKNFLYTLALFTALFFISIFIVSATSFSSALSSERSSALREEYMLSLTLQTRIDEVAKRENPSPLAVPSLVASYSPSYQRKGVYISLSLDDAELFSSLPFEASGIQLSAKQRICETVSVGDNKYLCISDSFSGSGEGYSFLYAKDITALYVSLKSQSFILILTGIGVSVLFAFALYFTLKKIYKPVNNLAHELRTPLTAIRGYAEYIRAAAATEEERYSAAEYIVEESKRLSDVCDRLLILANLREGDIRFEKADVSALFESAKMTFKNVKYEAERQYVTGDPALLQSMINNLVSNALKASPPGAIVHLKFYKNIIEVTDSGDGMNGQTLARVNKPGFTPVANAAGKGGNGLGIPLCHQIARLHGARLSFDSEEGGGTTARITFTSS